VLLTTHRLRLAAQPLGITKIDASEAQALLQFGPKAAVDPLRILELVQKQRHIKLGGQDKLRIEFKAPQVAARADAVRAVLRSLK
jgi:transcription-repair coupling factor (superfamily II helicase)